MGETCHNELDKSELMKEYKQYAEGTDIFHTEEIKVEETATHGAPVGELVMHHFMWNGPTHEKTGEETTDGEEDLTRDEVENIEE